eukprot:TRINITY_DN8191_c0_g1_i1.p1 TRINITY_DN8191_c0_g1~~TRINITY_DN8191_c0_g1_i1.p1  ORF type:complete len:285 (-),score=67.16 TRINITY_DN8191_c0_g1_i1:94-888(-)
MCIRDRTREDKSQDRQETTRQTSIITQTETSELRVQVSEQSVHSRLASFSFNGMLTRQNSTDPNAVHTNLAQNLAPEDSDGEIIALAAETPVIPVIPAIPVIPQITTEKYHDGSLYIGQIKDGKRDGQGKFFYPDGGMYDGEWSAGAMNGKGRLYYASGRLAYEGDFKNDSFSGKGILYNDQPVEPKGPLNHRDLFACEESWERYEGDLLEDHRHGTGTVYYCNNDKLHGQFMNDLAHGKCIFTHSEGEIIRGEWLQNKLVRLL